MPSHTPPRTHIHTQEGEEFVLQYEVKMEEPLSCGGAYVKLFDAAAPGVAEGEVRPYVLYRSICYWCSVGQLQSTTQFVQCVCGGGATHP